MSVTLRESWRTTLTEGVTLRPLVLDQQLIVRAGRFLVALDAATGSELWRADVDPLNGTGRVLVVVGNTIITSRHVDHHTHLVGVDLAGSALWESPTDTVIVDAYSPAGDELRAVGNREAETVMLAIDSATGAVSAVHDVPFATDQLRVHGERNYFARRAAPGLFSMTPDGSDERVEVTTPVHTMMEDGDRLLLTTERPEGWQVELRDSHLVTRWTRAVGSPVAAMGNSLVLAFESTSPGADALQPVILSAADGSTIATGGALDDDPTRAAVLGEVVAVNTLMGLTLLSAADLSELHQELGLDMPCKLERRSLSPRATRSVATRSTMPEITDPSERQAIIDAADWWDTYPPEKGVIQFRSVDGTVIAVGRYRVVLSYGPGERYTLAWGIDAYRSLGVPTISRGLSIDQAFHEPASRDDAWSHGEQLVSDGAFLLWIEHVLVEVWDLHRQAAESDSPEGDAGGSQKIVVLDPVEPVDDRVLTGPEKAALMGRLDTLDLREELRTALIFVLEDDPQELELSRNDIKADDVDVLVRAYWMMPTWAQRAGVVYLLQDQSSEAIIDVWFDVLNAPQVLPGGTLHIAQASAMARLRGDISRMDRYLDDDSLLAEHAAVWRSARSDPSIDPR